LVISRRNFHRLLLFAYSRLVFSNRPLLLLAEDTHFSLQALAAQVERLVVALQSAGAPLDPGEVEALHAAHASSEQQAMAKIEQILDAHVLIEARINPEGRVSVARGAARAELGDHRSIQNLQPTGRADGTCLGRSDCRRT
jgi:hypothetical protein